MIYMEVNRVIEAFEEKKIKLKWLAEQLGKRYTMDAVTHKAYNNTDSN